MLSVPEYALYEIHENGGKFELGLIMKVTLNAHVEVTHMSLSTYHTFMMCDGKEKLELEVRKSVKSDKLAANILLGT